MDRDLWAAVVLQAWRDFFDGVKNVNQEDEQRQAFEDARAFLFDTEGEWAESRSDVCHAAGFDPDAVRDRAIAKLWDDNQVASA